jgi:hypothetical protein
MFWLVFGYWHNLRKIVVVAVANYRLFMLALASLRDSLDTIGGMFCCSVHCVIKSRRSSRVIGAIN